MVSFRIGELERGEKPWRVVEGSRGHSAVKVIGQVYWRAEQ